MSINTKFIQGVFMSSHFSFRWLATLLILLSAVFSSAASAGTLTYKTSWLGNSYGDGDRFVQHNIWGLAVAPDGTCYASSPFDEGGRQLGIYKDGDVIGNAQYQGGGRAVAIDATYIYSAGATGVAKGSRNGGAAISNSSTWGSTTVKDSVVRGLATNNNELYISDFTNSKVVVYATSTLTQSRSWLMTRPGPIAIDGGGNVWVVQLKDATNNGRVLCYSSAGAPLSGRTISDLVDPTGVAVDNQGRLIVAENGPAQQVRIYSNITTAPTLSSTLGVVGGIYGGTRGEVGEVSGQLKFNGLTALGVDASGNIYVASNGPMEDSGTELRKISPTGVVQWTLRGLEFVDAGAIDPASETDLFTAEEHYVMDYSKSSGKEATYKGFTIDKTRYPDDLRVRHGIGGAKVYRIGGKRFLAVQRMNIFALYRFNAATDGEIAIPCMVVAPQHLVGRNNDTSWPPYQPAAGPWMWRDLDGDGAFDTNEYSALSGTWDSHVQSWNIDTNGDMWTQRDKYTAATRKFAYGGLDANGIPIYAAPPAETTVPEPITTSLWRVRYLPSQDVMILSGDTPDQSFLGVTTIGHEIARYNNWSGGNPSLAYRIVLPANGNDIPFCLDIAGDYIFVGMLSSSEIRVYDLKTGALTGTMTPGYEVGRLSGWLDTGYSITAHKRSNGEYIILAQEEVNGRILIYRWTPSTPVNGLKLWLKADAGVTKDANNQISAWADQSGNGNNALQSTLGNQPLWVGSAVNGKPVVRFDGANDVITAAGVTGTMNAFTVIWITNPAQLSSYNQTLVASGGSSQFQSQNLGQGSAQVGIGSTAMTQGNGAGQIPLDTIVPNTWQRFAFTMNGGPAAFYKNGALVASKNMTLPSAWTGFQLGVNSGDTINGDLPEVLVYNRALSDAELQAVDTYLKNKYDTRPPLQRDMLGWWKLDDGSGIIAKDSSGLDNHGVVSGSGSWNATGKIAGSYNANSTRITLPYSLIQTTKTLTFSCWFKTTAGGVLFGTQEPTAGSPPVQTRQVIYVGNDGKLRGMFYNGGAITPITSSQVVNDGEWHQAILVGNTDTQSLYLDGALVGTLAGTIDFQWLAVSYLGTGYCYSTLYPSTPANSWFPFSGQMDDVRLYGRALSTTEVSTLNKADGMLAWLKLDEGAGVVALDSSGNGNTGYLTDAGWSANGQIAGCLNLNGSNGNVRLPTDLIRGAGTSLTTSCWFKTSATGVLLGYQNVAYDGWPVEWTPALYIGADGKLRGEFWQGSVNPLTSLNAVNDNSWHHAALVGNGNTQSLYLDGSLIGTQTGQINHANMKGNQLGVGYTTNWPGGTVNWMLYSGQIDDFRLYGRALSSVEVAALAAG